MKRAGREEPNLWRIILINFRGLKPRESESQLQSVGKLSLQVEQVSIGACCKRIKRQKPPQPATKFNDLIISRITEKS